MAKGMYDFINSLFLKFIYSSLNVFESYLVQLMYSIKESLCAVNSLSKKVRAYN
jgi:hypothetical protein